MSRYRNKRISRIPYVSVAKRQERARKQISTLKKKGQKVLPVVIEGKNIATTFWGKAWCNHFTKYCDMENRLPRGRSYVKNGAVIHLDILPGEIQALVQGAHLYDVSIKIDPIDKDKWTSICNDSRGSISSLVEILQGKLSQSVMDRVCAPEIGLFPLNKQIKLQCNCPDWTDMCKHVSAALYGFGARLDTCPELLFKLRQVDENDLLSNVAELTFGEHKLPDQIILNEDIFDIFGLDMASNSDDIEVKKSASVKKRKIIKKI